MLCGLLVVATSCGGGGGGGDIGPLWVPTDVVIADIDGDGRPDVLTIANYTRGYGQNEGHLLLYRQTSTPGVFDAPADYVVGRYSWRLAVGDIDGDGRPDLVVADPDAKIVWMLRQDPAHPGTFLAPQALIGGTARYDAAIADLNNDGAPDVAVPDADASALVILYQDPANRGTFGPPVNVALPGRPSNLTAGDIDGDGLADVLVWVYTNPSGSYPPTAGLVPVYQKPGGFDVSGVLASQMGHNVDRLAIADANGDGRRDLLAFETPFSADHKAQLVVVPQSSTPRSFDSPHVTSLAGVEGIDDAVFADMNQDTVPDAVVAGSWPEAHEPYPTMRARVTLFPNNGLGDFGSLPPIDVSLLVDRVTAGDLDGDGRNDIVLLGGDNVCQVMFQLATGAFSAPRPLH
jgi:hypothetical protein